MTTAIKAGFGKGTICFPEELFPVEGFCGVHDNPHMRLMLLRLEDTAFALLEAELVIIPRTSIQGWREKISSAFGIPVEQVVVQMTHAFTTPHEPGPMGPPHLRPEPTAEDLRKREIYHRVTDRAVEEAIAQTKQDLSNAVLSWGSGECDVNVNCDVQTPFGWWLGANDSGYSNHTMTVLRVNDTAGKLKGIFVSFGMKPAAIDNAGRKQNKRLISSEVAGAFCEQMEDDYGVPVIYSVSAGGNQIPRESALKQEVTAQGEVREIDEGPEQGFAYAERQGAQMCEDAKKIVEQIACDEEISDGKWARCSLRWPRRKGGPRRLMKELTHTPEGDTELTADVFRLGGTVFVMVRPELTAEAGRLLLTACGDQRTILMTLTNGEMKCLPERDAFQRGTYEAQGSNLMPGAAEALIGAITNVIQEGNQDGH
ncbi:MAG: hypothetical protein HDT38_02920 [Clostridiales bacterium]|nr:hypothetical protein [Clostridiales bacterium]